jgi:hypothetical protein
MFQRARVVSGVAVALCVAVGTARGASTVTCQDGTTATAGRGACSHHGGVAKSAAPAAPAPRSDTGTSGAAGVTCADGTSGSGGRGACSGHGGVAREGKSPPAIAQPESKRTP